jgi:hypothetical protein
MYSTKHTFTLFKKCSEWYRAEFTALFKNLILCILFNSAVNNPAYNVKWTDPSE